jgi:hypothetical protein
VSKKHCNQFLWERIFSLEAPTLQSLYPKGKNREVSKHLQVDDLRGTDLYEALANIVGIAERLQGVA